MDGLTEKQEEVLGLIMSVDGKTFRASSCAMKPFFELSKSGFIEMQGDASGCLAIVKHVYPEGVAHVDAVKDALANAGYELLSESAEQLLRCVAWVSTTAKANNGSPDFSDCLNGDKDDFDELSRKGYLKLQYADNRVYGIMSVTDKGWDFVRARVRPVRNNGMPNINIENSPTFNNCLSNSQSQTQYQEASLGDVVNIINNSNELSSEESSELISLLSSAQKAGSEVNEDNIGRILKIVAGKSFELLKIILPFILKLIFNPPA
ncbi:MAG: hypothetical protein KHZ79_07105 [Atopobium minutum]|uniref:hypothetical protein n=1 Tax=Atopobium minutum TaxID=1381 RepID=UPI001D86F05A|nr:hypothetical protein [Atopobium minutum]MBS4874125.1 hypothetical protein [Atopobium minutum]